MNSEINPHKPHSAEYFNESRDYWWNSDFLELMAQRLNFDKISSVLDVGCGIGHWGQLLANVLPQNAKVCGIDREETWISNATDRAKAFNLQDRYTYQPGDLYEIPFSDNTFDLVTCQTVLIHLQNPKKGLKEMLRVLKSGGLILAAEPNNFSNQTMLNSKTEYMPVDDIMDLLRFDLIVQRGKKALGLGFNSIGDLIPGYLAELNVEKIKVYLSDKATPLYPPYESKDQQANLQLLKDWTNRKFIGWDQEEVLGYFVAGGGLANEFDHFYKLRLKEMESSLKAIDDGKYHSAGGAVTYLISAIKI